MANYDNAEAIAPEDRMHQSSAVMINNCFRHQHPEAYGEPEVPEPVIPAYLRYGRDEPVAPSGACFEEEAMGASSQAVRPAAAG